MTVPTYCNGSELAHILGISPSRVLQLRAQGMPKHSRAQWHIAECVQWVIQRWQTASQNDHTLDEQRKALLFEQTKRTHLENQVTEGKLFDGDEVQGAVDAIMTLFVGQLDSLAPRVCNRLAGLHDAGEIKSELYEECREIRNTLADALEELGEHIQAKRGADKAAATPGRKPVGGRGKNTTARKSRARKVAQ